eukprot:TRINITY_DN34297_c0_g1_i2.p1 TRINITY_DN34297_c0_g1~~TRINITY_DN34297_c0_g1_i2.p1  ORF type:complete len:153 (-),score=16.02 TRINITY_DN34297_c0_g1_i2:293-751(-)
MPMVSRDGPGRVWRYPRYDDDGYDKDCPAQSMIVAILKKIKPEPQPQPYTAVVAGVRNLARLREANRRARGMRFNTAPVPEQPKKDVRGEQVDEAAQHPENAERQVQVVRRAFSAPPALTRITVRPPQAARGMARRPQPRRASLVRGARVGN